MDNNYFEKTSNPEYSKFIHLSRYSRWRDDLGRRESWEETVDRYIEFWHRYFGEGTVRNQKATLCLSLSDIHKTLDNEIKPAILNMEVVPSMRALMTAGPALERDHMAGYNCFAGDMEFITDQGYRTFVDTAGETVNVLAVDGAFRPAKVMSFGSQKLQQVTFRPTKSRSSIRVFADTTPDHRWITKNRGEVTDLRVGDVVASNVVDESGIDPVAWVRGFGYGDGTVDARGRARVRLCGDKNKYLHMFETAGNCSIMYPPSQEEDALVVFHQRYLSDWKDLPYDKTDDIRFIRSWLEGYLAADGHNNPIQPGLSTQNVEAAEFVENYAPLCGYVVTGMNVSSVTETNYGKRRSPLIRVTLREECDFYVTAIEELDEQEVFCAVEPVTGTFTLWNGLLTGNCSYIAINRVRAFDEMMYVLLCGTGVGFSVERQFINDLPDVAEEFEDVDTVIRVRDSKVGWASALKELVSLLYAGSVPRWDTSKVRPAGSRLKTFGGRASGPEPLEELFQFTVDLFKGAAGRKLNSLECHDLCCKIADIVVVGGVRRSALISLSNLTDERMRRAKSGMWWEENPQRALANNSVCYTENPDMGIFMDEWRSLYESKSGERGIFSRKAAHNKVPERRQKFLENQQLGTNPCNEVLLRDRQVCNLSEVVVRPDDSLEDLKKKVRVATIIGTLQSLLTDFRYLSKKWRENCEEERLLGVSLTGIMDHPIMSGEADLVLTMGFELPEDYGYEYDEQELKDVLRKLKDEAIETNKIWAEHLGINPSTAITCVKPSGTVSQLVDSASGIHPRFSHYYIRTVRADQKDPLAKFMIGQGFPYEVDQMKPDKNYVFSFPVKSPEGAVVRDDVSALEQLELWKVYALHWTEHKPSVTVYVREDEWLEVAAWCWRNFDILSGVSFLPYSDHIYRQAPYQPVSKEEYEDFCARMPEGVEWDRLGEFESADNTTFEHELACSAGACEIE